MLQGRWQLGNILGIPFYLDRSWFAIAALLTWSNGALLNQLFFRQSSPWLGFILGFVLALLLFASVLLHELGHSLVARYQGIRVNS
ncbi:MAG: site-2 protease family protein, partial [Cyanobacteriota bacterium]